MFARIMRVMIPIQRRWVIGAAAVILTAAAWLILCRLTADARQARRLDVLPEAVLTELSLSARERRPMRWALVTDTELLRQAGLHDNPGFLLRRADREMQIRAGAAVALVALYGETDEARFALRGLFFRDADDAAKYAAVQAEQARRVAGFRRETPGGVWMVFLACDPKAKYAESEMDAIRRGMERYRRRLNAEPMFDHLGNAE